MKKSSLILTSLILSLLLSGCAKIDEAVSEVKETKQQVETAAKEVQEAKNALGSIGN